MEESEREEAPDKSCTSIFQEQIQRRQLTLSHRGVENFSSTATLAANSTRGVARDRSDLRRRA
jgi:hypothetical protein